MEGSLGRQTASDRRSILKRFAAVVGPDPARITAARCRKWMATLYRLSPGTRRGHYVAAKLFLGWLVEQGVAKRNHLAAMPAPKVPRSAVRVLDSDQTAALLAVCSDPRDRLIVTLCLQLGLRRAEVARLEVGDISLAAGTVFVTGKGGHQRNLPLTDRAKTAVRLYLRSSAISAGPLIRQTRFPTRSVTPGWVGERMSELMLQAGVKNRGDFVGMHAFRRTAATDTYAHCHDVVAVQQMLGHASLSTTQSYVRSGSPEVLRQAMSGRDYDLRTTEAS